VGERPSALEFQREDLLDGGVVGLRLMDEGPVRDLLLGLRAL